MFQHMAKYFWTFRISPKEAITFPFLPHFFTHSYNRPSPSENFRGNFRNLRTIIVIADVH